MKELQRESIARLRADVARAAERLSDLVRKTPVDTLLYPDAGSTVFAKLENLQHTGSFKVRGAFNKMLTMAPGEMPLACVTASSGNHGQACAWVAKALGIAVTVFVPEDTARTKLDGIRKLGGTIRVAGEDCVDTERVAREWSAERGLEYIPPYNDLQVIAGQGSVGAEMTTQMDPADIVCVAVGGGGLISGIAACLDEAWPDARIIGCLPENSPVMARSVEAGGIVEWPVESTLSDGTAGGIEPGAVTFELCQALVDEFMLVSEAEIGEALRRFVDGHHMLAEGAAGVALAAAEKLARQASGQRIAVVVCGANIDRKALAAVLSQG